MLLQTKTKDGYDIVASSAGVMVSGPTEELAAKLLEKIEQSKSRGGYKLCPDKIIFFEDIEKRDKK